MSTSSPDFAGAPSDSRPKGPFVLLRRVGKTLAYEELGVVVEGPSAQGWRYRTVSGEELSAPREPGFMQAERGSIIHILRAYPDQLTAALTDHPVEVIEQYVSEKEKGTTAAKVKSELSSSGIDRKTVADAWVAAQKSLVSNDEFTHEGQTYTKRFGRPLRREILAWVTIPEYSEIPSTDDPSGGTADSETEPESDDASPSVDAPAPQVAQNESVADADDEPRAAADANDDAAPAAAAVVETPDTAPPAGARTERNSLLAALASVGAPVDSITDPSTHVLAIATQLADGDLPITPTRFKPRESELWMTLQSAIPSTERDRTGRAPLDQAAGTRAVVSAVAEIEGADAARRGLLAPSAFALVDRLLLARKPIRLQFDLLVRTIAALAALPRPEPYGDVFGGLVSVAAGQLERVKDDRHLQQLRDSELLGALARAVSTLPITALPRIDLLRALHDKLPQSVANSQWWAGVSAVDLVAAAGGLLRDMLADPFIVKSVVAPRVNEALARVKTRADLFSIAAAPAAVADAISGDAFERGFKLAAQADSTASGWLRYLTRTTQMDALRGDLDAAVQRAEAAESRLAELTTTIAELETERNRLLERARSAREAAASGQAARDRQVKFSTLRSLAELAASIAVSPAAADPVLRQQSSLQLDREGLTSIGVVGDAVPYDPTAHDSQGQSLNPGQTVVVVRPGYTVSNGDQKQVLVKARISAQ